MHSQMDWMLRRRQLVTVLPGVYAVPEQARTFAGRVRAAACWEPDLVFTGATAARLSFWPDAPGGAVTAALRRRREPAPGFTWSRRRLPPELVTERWGYRLTVPAVTALDLCDEVGGDGIDVVLRERCATLADLWDALAAGGGRRGNSQRRQLLLESRSKPWSRAERVAHRLLHDEGITGWEANHPVDLSGVQVFVDVAFPAARLVLEVDGWEYHSDREAFERDRWRQNALVLAGWRVLRITWKMLTQEPGKVAHLISQALATRP